MGGFASTHRFRADKPPPQPAEAKEFTSSPTPAATTTPPNDVKMEETAVPEVVGKGESITEGQLGSLRVKDPEAWKGSTSPRPRSALKHGGSSVVSCADSDGSGLVERTASGRRMPRKVSFQVQGLGAPPELGAEAGGDGADGLPAHKRVRSSDEFSMRFLVDKFYGKVLAQRELMPFFDGVDMHKLKNQQEALFLLVFGGHELLEDELPGLSADLRLIHLHLLFEGLNLTHWQLFADIFGETLDELPQIPDDVKQRAKSYMATTKHHFRPMEGHEWPPKVVYKGWTKRSCPFHTTVKRFTDPESGAVATAEGEDAGIAKTAPVAAAPAGPAVDDDDFILPGFNGPPTRSPGTSASGAAPSAS